MRKTYRTTSFSLLFAMILPIVCLSQKNHSRSKAIDTSIYDIRAKTIDGDTIKISKYEGKVILIVNVASKCGFTEQYQELEMLYEKYHDQGFEILGFPCNQFLHQEPGTDKEIYAFCSTKFGVSFQMFSKIDVNGSHAHPLYNYLSTNAYTAKREPIKWNFEKFLINKKGQISGRFRSKETPVSLDEHIKQLLEEK